MKISEVISLTREQRLSEIAKTYLSIGEKPARMALKNAGAKPQPGKKGWIFEGPKENLDKSIYDFTEGKATRKQKSNVTTKKDKNIDTKEDNNIEGKEVLINSLKVVERKRASFDIDKELLKRLKVKSVMEERKIYEMVEEAIRDYLEK